MVRKLWNAYRLTPESIRMAFGLMLLAALLLGGHELQHKSHLPVHGKHQLVHLGNN
jgi:hypothetical protein